LHDPITDLVVLVFSRPGTALELAGAILLFALWLIGSSEVFEQRPLVKALIERCNLLAGINGRNGFAEQYGPLDQRFASASSPPTLVRGWKAYRALLARQDDGTFAASLPASQVFDRMDDPARSLEWWANIVVAVGLTITFMGIVAALSEATSAIAGSPAGVGVEGALVSLLAIAATKFWTSIAGVLSSIILRLVARRRRNQIEALEADLFQGLDASVEFSPPERVMMEQLAILQRIETTLAGAAGA
jgi:hypothetical protein